MSTKKAVNSCGQLLLLNLVALVLCFLGCSNNPISSPEEFPTSAAADGYELSISDSSQGPAAMPAPQVTFAIPEAGHVKITLKNATGYEIKVLVDQDLQAGVHEVDLELTNKEGKSLTTGIYLLELIAGEFHQLKVQFYLF